MPGQQIADIVSNNIQDYSISASSVYSVKHNTGFHYLALIVTFATTKEQRQRRKDF